MSYKYDFMRYGRPPMGIGNNLFILGTSEDGPYMEPMRIATVEQARKVFGDESKGTLVNAFIEAHFVRSEISRDFSIYLMRITGKSATLRIGGLIPEEFAAGRPRWTDDALSFTSTSAGSKYNNVQVILQDTPIEEIKNLIIRVPFDSDYVYNLSEYDNIGQLTERLNRDARSGLIPTIVSTAIPECPISSFIYSFEENEGADYLSYESAPRFLEGGDDGIDVVKNDIYIELEQAYELLLGRPVDMLTIAGVYVDDVYPKAIYTDEMMEQSGIYNEDTYAEDRDYLDLVDTQNGNSVVTFHEQMIRFCKQQMWLGYMTHGVIGFNPLREIPEDHDNDDSYILHRVSTAIIKDRYGLMDFKDGKWIDDGYFISIVCAETVFNEGEINEYFANAATTYAALMTAHFDTTTNVKLPSGISLRYELSESTMSELAKIGVVTYRDSVRHGLVVNSGVTASLWTHELHNVSNLRMVQLTIAFVNELIDYVYENDFAYSDSARRRTLEGMLIQRMDELIQLGIITWYDYNVVFAETAPIGAIHLKLMTKYTVEAISTSAKIERRT